VQEVDVPRKRIALTMRLNDEAPPARSPGTSAGSSGQASGKNRSGSSGSLGGAKPNRGNTPEPAGGAMAAAFAKLKR
jgi:uncharacterized protein